MATRLFPPYFAFTNSSGAVLAGGTVTFYEEGTTTPKDTFSDSALTTANTNPVVLNAAGKASVAMWGEGEYKIVLKDASGVEQTPTTEELLGVTSQGLSGGYDTVSAMTAATKAGLADGGLYEIKGYSSVGDGGGGTFRWSASSTSTADSGTVFAADEGGAGRWLRVYSGDMNVKWFGAKGDAVDDTTALAAANTAAAGKGLFFPNGVYYTDNVLNLTTQGTRLHGESTWGVTLGLASGSADAACVDVQARLCEVSNMLVSAPNTKKGVYLSAGQLFRSRNLTVKNAQYGIHFENCNSSDVTGLFAESCTTGILMKPSGAEGNCNNITLHGRAYNCTTGFNMDKNDDAGIDPSYNKINISAESNTTGISVTSDTDSTQQRGNTFQAYAEANTTNWSVTLVPANRWYVEDPDGDFPTANYLDYSNVDHYVGLNLYHDIAQQVTRERTQSFAASGSISGIVGRFYVVNTAGATLTLTLNAMSSAKVGTQIEIVKLYDAVNTAGFTLTAPGGMSLLDVGGTWGASPTTYAKAVATKVSSTQILIERSAA